MEKENFHINPQLVKQTRDRQASKEKLLYMTLCSPEDRRKINGDSEMTVHDFERISYLLEVIGLPNFALQFDAQHLELLDKLGKEIEYDVENTDVQKLWQDKSNLRHCLEDFHNQLPSPILQTYFDELLKL